MSRDGGTRGVRPSSCCPERPGEGPQLGTGAAPADTGSAEERRGERRGAPLPPSRRTELQRPRRAPPRAPREQRPGAEGSGQGRRRLRATGGAPGRGGTAESRRRGHPESRGDPRRGRPPPPAIQRRRGGESAALRPPRPTERPPAATPRPRLRRHRRTPAPLPPATLTSRCPSAAAAAQHPPHPPLPAPAPRTGSAHGPARREGRGGASGVGGLRLADAREGGAGEGSPIREGRRWGRGLGGRGCGGRGAARPGETAAVVPPGVGPCRRPAPFRRLVPGQSDPELRSATRRRWQRGAVRKSLTAAFVCAAVCREERDRPRSLQRSRSASSARVGAFLHAVAAAAAAARRGLRCGAGAQPGGSCAHSPPPISS